MQPDAAPHVRPIASLVSAPIEIERALMPALEESLNDYSKQEVQGVGEAQRVGAVMPAGADIVTCKSDNGVTTVVDHETKTWYRVKAQYEFGAQVPSGTVMNGIVYWMPVEQGNEVTGNLRLTISFFDLQQRGLENFDRLPLLDMVMIDGNWQSRESRYNHLIHFIGPSLVDRPDFKVDRHWIGWEPDALQAARNPMLWPFDVDSVLRLA